MLFYTTFARRTFTLSLNELFENYTGRHTHVYSGRMTRLKYPPCFVLFFLDNAIFHVRPFNIKASISKCYIPRTSTYHVIHTHFFYKNALTFAEPQYS